jgi:tetratricopeptide (TPR) repeat protein
MLGRVVVGLWLAILAVVPAAAQDYPRGMEAYRQGNYLAALRNWRPLAERGHAPSQSSLGFLYNYGHGVERNYRQALKWYRKAAQQGFAPAQYHLGFLYTKGLGVAQDYVKAHMWFELGAVGGLSYSDKNRAIVARRMTPEQIAEARDLARNWRAAKESRSKESRSEKSGGKEGRGQESGGPARQTRSASGCPAKAEVASDAGHARPGHPGEDRRRCCAIWEG